VRAEHGRSSGVVSVSSPAIVSVMQLSPAMAADPAHGVAVDYPAAVWVGSVNLDDLEAGADISLIHGTFFRRARLLVWQDDALLGFVEMEVTNATIKADALLSEVERLPPPRLQPRNATYAPISVIVCTRDRPEDLGKCLEALLEVDYPEYEIVVVDSASRTSASRDIVEALAGVPIRYLRIDQRGLARARNAGVALARHELLAFTDDDVVVDKRWLSWINDGFSQAADVSCVTGLVASGQLESDAQHYFDRRVTWASNVSPSVFRLSHPPAGIPLFPFQFGVYGTGANFALRRAELGALGGFDNALGAGSATGAGEDTDIFIRLILSGHAIFYQPNAVVWHKHRLESSALANQLESYGIGIGAVVSKLLCDRTARRLMVPLGLRGAKHATAMVRVNTGSSGAQSVVRMKGNASKELLGLLRGPVALLRARRHEAHLLRKTNERISG
jgi:glycosyltransferase involved in cell wall biosynthesis